MEIVPPDSRRHVGVALESVQIPPRKADLEVAPLVLVWTPWRVAADGSAQPAWSERAT